MKQIRKSVFETNSSSSHSISIEYINPDRYKAVIKIPEGLKGDKPSIFDVLNSPLIQSGMVYNEVDKLRIIVSLITELIKEEYKNKLIQEWKEKYQDRNRKSFDYFGFFDYYNKKTNQKMAKRYIYEHSYWKYLNALLKIKRNVVIDLYDTLNYFPYISEQVDYEEGAETESYFYSLGFSFGMSRKDFMNRCNEIIFNPEIAISQYCERD